MVVTRKYALFKLKEKGRGRGGEGEGGGERGGDIRLEKRRQAVFSYNM